jgi:hypothetical protein
MTPRDRIPEHPGELVLLDYLVGQLPDEMKDQVRRHVGSCRACRQTMQDLSTIVDDFDRLPMVAIPHDSPRGLTLPFRRRSRLRTILPGALLLAIALAATIVMGVFRAEPSAPSDPFQTLHLTLTDPAQPANTLTTALKGQPVTVATDATNPHTLYVLTPDDTVRGVVNELRNAFPTDQRGSYTVVVMGTGSRLPAEAQAR